MKYYLLAIMLVVCPITVNAQSFSELLQEGKTIIKTERAKPMQEGVADYTKAIEVLTKAANMQPNDPEVLYFLGSALDYNRDPEGAASLRYIKLPQTIVASQQFEKLIKVSPKYTGESMVLDPYSKLTSIWGCMAFAYMYNNNKDSAKWAFTEGKKRGGFSDFSLAFYRYQLLDVPKDAIFFSLGDISTMSMWYLQEIEHLRHDVTVISIGLMQSSWYTEYVYQHHPTIFSSRRAAADTAATGTWNEMKLATVFNKKTGKPFSWKIPERNSNGYLIRSDFTMLDILKTNQFIKPIFFETGTETDDILGLGDYLSSCFLYYQLTTEKKPKPSKQLDKALNAFPFEVIKTANKNCELEMLFVQSLQVVYVTAVGNLASNDKKAEAKTLYEKFKKGIPPETFPYTNENMKTYVEKLDEYLKITK